MKIDKLSVHADKVEFVTENGGNPNVLLTNVELLLEEENALDLLKEIECYFTEAQLIDIINWAVKAKKKAVK